jgi:hypothetical protein
MATDEENKSASALTSLEDDAVKLIAYSIVSLKRGHERILDGGEGSVIVTDRMTGKAFMSWIVAKYLQDEVDVPGQPGRKQRRGDLIPGDELKYLRVYYVVSNRWPREPLEFEQKQVRVLKEIRDEIGKP